MVGDLLSHHIGGWISCLTFQPSARRQLSVCGWTSRLHLRISGMGSEPPESKWRSREVLQQLQMTRSHAREDSGSELL